MITRLPACSKLNEITEVGHNYHSADTGGAFKACISFGFSLWADSAGGASWPLRVCIRIGIEVARAAPSSLVRLPELRLSRPFFRFLAGGS